jgi:ubiquinol-cytochrome c reductase cytochrome c1 subunit
MKSIVRTLFVIPVLALCLLTSSTVVFAASEEVALDTAPINLKDQASLQRGAKTFVNYCMNCHNASFMRYSHLTAIGLSEDQIKANLMFGTDKIGDTMISALDPKDAKEWFGGLPPDLTLVARVRGSDWLYTFLRSFHRDDAAPTGWNNTVFKNVGMPNVLHDLQGTQVLKQDGEKDEHGKKVPIMKLAVDRAGTMNQMEYDLFVKDLVNYLTYMGEPARPARTQLGVLVLLFLVLAFFATLWLKNEYWKDVK